MSISFKKINSMIETQVDDLSDVNDAQKRILVSLCKKIYTLESSGTRSAQQTISDIKAQIIKQAQVYKGE